MPGFSRQIIFLPVSENIPFGMIADLRDEERTNGLISSDLTEY
jgi:hypothetical protein